MKSVRCKHCENVLFQYEKEEKNQNIIVHCRKCEINIEVSFDNNGSWTTKDVDLDIENINSTWPWPGTAPT